MRRCVGFCAAGVYMFDIPGLLQRDATSCYLKQIKMQTNNSGSHCNTVIYNVIVPKEVCKAVFSSIQVPELEFRKALQWRHNGCGIVSNNQPHDCLLNRLFRRKSKKTSKLRVTGLCAGNSPGTGEFPAQMASNAENVSIWWRHHGSIQKSMEYHSRLTWV